MDCNRVVELLPWLLNTTLEEAERAEVVEHLDSCESCRRELEATVEAFELFDVHPRSEELVAFAFGGDVRDRRRVERHIESCASCIEDVALVRAADGVEVFERPSRDADRRRVARWRSAALAAAAVAVVALATAIGGRMMPGMAPVGTDDERAVLERRIDALAAEEHRLREERDSLASRLERVEAMLGDLRQKVAALALPRSNVPVVELLPASFTIRGDGEVATVEGSAEVVVLILAAGPAVPDGDLRLVVRDPEGRTVWVVAGLERSTNDDFTAQLPAARLPPGTSSLVLEGRHGEDWIELETYRLRVKR